MKLILATVLALTTLSGAALAGAAAAQTNSASVARIPFGDLNLSTASGAAAFDSRVAKAAQTMCRNATRPASRLNDSAHCTAAVRAEAVSQLPTPTRARYVAHRPALTL